MKRFIMLFPVLLILVACGGEVSQGTIDPANIFCGVMDTMIMRPFNMGSQSQPKIDSTGLYIIRFTDGRVLPIMGPSQIPLERGKAYNFPIQLKLGPQNEVPYYVLLARVTSVPEGCP